MDLKTVFGKMYIHFRGNARTKIYGMTLPSPNPSLNLDFGILSLDFAPESSLGF